MQRYKLGFKNTEFSFYARKLFAEKLNHRPNKENLSYLSHYSAKTLTFIVFCGTIVELCNMINK